MNKATGAPKGCAGAVWADGTFSEDYCENKGWAKGRFPWWGKCCAVQRHGYKAWKSKECANKN